MREDTQVVEDTLGLGAGQELGQAGVEGWAGVSRGAEVLGEPHSPMRPPPGLGVLEAASRRSPQPRPESSLAAYVTGTPRGRRAEPRHQAHHPRDRRMYSPEHRGTSCRETSRTRPNTETHVHTHTCTRTCCPESCSLQTVQDPCPLPSWPIKSHAGVPGTSTVADACGGGSRERREAV